MSFPEYKTWVQDVLHPRDRTDGKGPYCFETADWHKTYQIKARIAAAIRPVSVLEIGIRYGYSAHAFLQCPTVTSYVGIDVDDPVINAMGEPTCAWAMEMLGRTTRPTIRREFIKVNTRISNIRELGLAAFDFSHIDADHTYKGALDDLVKVWGMTQRAMLVDDYFGSPSVRDAVDTFVAQYGAILLTAPSCTGEALLVK